MRWYTAIGMKKDDADGRFCVWVDARQTHEWLATANFIFSTF